jgi:hypothetical protein
MALRIGVLFKDQHESLVVALRALMPAADVIGFEPDGVIDNPAGQARIAALLKACDHVVSQDISPVYGPLCTKILSASVPRFHLFPAFHFGGFHPDAVTLTLDRIPISGPTGRYHSRIVLASYIAGFSAAEGADLFNRLVFSRLGYFRAIAEQAPRLIDKYAVYGIDLSGELPKWMARGCFMYTPDRPKMLVFLDLARVICGMMGLVPGRTPLITTLADPFASGHVLPFFPDIAAHTGMQPEGAYRGALPALPMTMPDFVEASYTALKRVPMSCVQAADGVAETLTKLELKPARRPATIASRGTTALLSTHGTIVRADLASAMLVQEQLWPASDDCADFTFTPLTTEDGALRADILGGIDLLAAAPPGAVSVRRQGRLLSVEPGRVAVLLNRPEALLWESFLPLSVADVDTLRHILSQRWSADGETQPIPAAMIRVREGFVLDFGAFTVDLTQNFPVTTEQDGAAYLLQTQAGPRTIRIAADGAARQEILLRPAGPLADLAEAGSLPQFRSTTNMSFVVDAPDEILHPPLTVSTADALWVFEKNRSPGGVPIGRQHYLPKLMRASDKAVLLSRGLEGIIFGRAGVVKDYGTWGAPNKPKLPQGFRGQANAMLMDEAVWRDAPQIEGPVAVCCHPGPQNYYHATVETALPLWTMSRYLPRNTRILMPPTVAATHEAGPHQPGQKPLDHHAVLAALGLGHVPTLQPDAPVCRVDDVIWMDNSLLPNFPAAELQRFRAAVAAMYPPAAGPRQRLYVKRRRFRKVVPNKLLLHFLAKQDFVTVELEEMTQSEQIRLFQNAEIVVAAHGAGLANLMFCPAGTRVLELSPDAEFRPNFWMIAEKLGLPYGVLRCPTHDGTFNGHLDVELERFRVLFRILRQVDTRP